MTTERIYLEDGNPDFYLDIYIATPLPDWDFKRKALLVIPGGGYCAVCTEREGDPIALAFIPYGFNAFVLHYSVGKDNAFPRQLIEASIAMKYIKDHAEEYHIVPEEVFAIGFSAGGHLAASLGTLWHIKEVYDAVDMPCGYNKPAGVLPIYPVITGDPSCSHAGSICSLFRTEKPTQEQLKLASLENHVDENTCPMFLMHTSVDAVVPVENSLRMATALAQKGHPFEMHIYPVCGHGVSVANDITSLGSDNLRDPEVAKWIDAAAKWMERIASQK